jgi:hypothetical protein
VVSGFVFFFVITKVGERLMTSIERSRAGDDDVEPPDEPPEIFENDAVTKGQEDNAPVPNGHTHEMNPGEEIEIELTSF